MKKALKFIINLIISLIVSLPCFVLLDWVEQRNHIDWVDALMLMIAVSIVLAILTKRFKRNNPNTILKEITVFIISVTFLFGLFTLLEYLFDQIASKEFIYNWSQKLALSISLTAFENLNNWNKKNRLFADKWMVVAAECQELVEAEKMCAMLEENGIKAMIADKNSPMYIKNEGTNLIQVQVMQIDLKKAKDLIK